MKEKINTCKSCTHWKNEQSELDYTKIHGICTCFKWMFSTNGDADCLVLDRENQSDKHMGTQRFENQNNHVPFGTPNRSRYCLVTEENFGCIHHARTNL